ncbi:MAG: hypothetical protein IT158_24085 [Bryobacterales bacterium]|nr:hypothetical protein [Bryobacterales bacterium]
MIVTKAELARELQCSKGAIAYYVSRGGLPVRADGKLDREAALRWLVQYSSGVGGGWFGGSGRGAGLVERAEALLAGEPVEVPAARRRTRRRSELSGPRQEYDRVRERFAQLPGLLLDFERDVPAWLPLVVAELADAAAGALALIVDRAAPDFNLLGDSPDTDQAPLRDVTKAEFKAAGRKINAAEWKAAVKRSSEFIERMDDLLLPEDEVSK